MEAITLKKRATLKDKLYIDAMNIVANGLENDTDTDDALEKANELLNMRQIYIGKFDWSDYKFTDENTGKVGLKDFLGKVIIPSVYDDVKSDFHSYVQCQTLPVAVKRDGKWALCKSDGSNKILTPFKYSSIEWQKFSKLFITTLEPDSKTCGIIDVDGKVYIEDGIEKLYECSNGQQQYTANGKYGMILTSTDTVVPPVYDTIQWNEDEPMIFSREGKEFYLDFNGKEYLKDSIDPLDTDVELVYDQSYDL